MYKYPHLYFLFFFYYCTSLQKIHLSEKDQNFPKYLYSEVESFPQVEPIRVSDSNLSVNKQFLEDQINIHVKEIQYDGTLEARPTHSLFLKHSFQILVDSLLEKIKNQYSYINFSKDSSFATHTLNISVNTISKGDDPFTFQIQFQIQRKNSSKVYYDFIITPIVLQPLNQKRKIHILSKTQFIEFRIPEETFSLEIPLQDIYSLIDGFATIGKGSVSITSSTKNQIKILKQDNLLWEGESPVHLPLKEGEYTLYAYKRGMEPQKIFFSILEKEKEIIPIKWKDEVSSSYINFFSNQNLRVVFDEELKGTTPIFISEVPKGNYKIEISKKKDDFYEVLYKEELEVKENHFINLFYPMFFRETFSQESFLENSKRFFWFFPKNSLLLQENSFSKGFFTFLQNQQLFTPNIILDETKSEFNLFCHSCEVIFYFENNLKLLFKKSNEYLFVYYGKDPLELKAVYLLKENALFFYWDYSNSDQMFCVYVNSSLAFEGNIPSPYVLLEFKNIKDLILKDFALSEKNRDNFLTKSFYLFQKRFQKKENQL